MSKLESEAERYSHANALIEDIYKFKRGRCVDLGILEVIIEYSHYSDIPIQEIGNILSDHSDYVNILTKELEREKYSKIEEITETEVDSEEW